MIGEIAPGRLSQRAEVIGLLSSAPQATVASVEEVLTIVERRQLFGLGIGYIDARPLAATLLTRTRHCGRPTGALSAAAAGCTCAFDAAGTQ